tara:strand:+ start:650 stop:2080 length:1431 start_codon:yes stop_codon:yes gene_type:complete
MTKSLTFDLKPKNAFVYFLLMLDIDSNFILKIIQKENFDAIYETTKEKFNKSEIKSLDDLGKSITGGGGKDFFSKYQEDTIGEIYKDIMEKDLSNVIFVMFIFFKCARVMSDYIYNDEYNFSNYNFSAEKLYNIFMTFNMVMSVLIFSIRKLKEKMGPVNLEDYSINSSKKPSGSPSNDIVVFNEKKSDKSINQFKLAYLFFHIKLETFDTDKKEIKKNLLKKFKLENEKIENEEDTRTRMLIALNYRLKSNNNLLERYKKNIEKHSIYIKDKEERRKKHPLQYQIKDNLSSIGRNKIKIAEENIEFSEEFIKRTEEENKKINAIQDVFVNVNKKLNNLSDDDKITIGKINEVKQGFESLNRQYYYTNKLNIIDKELEPLDHMKVFAENLDYNPFIFNIMMIIVKFFNFMNFYKNNIIITLNKQRFQEKEAIIILVFFINMLISIRPDKIKGGRKTIRKYTNKRSKRSKRRSYKKN